MDKPITLAKRDFEKNLTNLVNTSGLPPIILEPIFKDMYNDVRLMAKRQLDADTERYAKFLKENGDNDEIHE